VASFALVIAMLSVFGANGSELLGLLKTGALVAAVLVVLGAFGCGYLLSVRERGVVLGLGTAQRNVAAAMVIATRDFTDPRVLVMITASVLVGLLVLFPLAWVLRTRGSVVAPLKFPLPGGARPPHRPGFAS
jgi:BASS family bile acid:Na+ symporter